MQCWKNTVETVLVLALCVCVKQSSASGDLELHQEWSKRWKIEQDQFYCHGKNKSNKSSWKGTLRILDYVETKAFISHIFPLWNSCKCYSNFRVPMSIPLWLFQSELPRTHWANFKLFNPSPHITWRGWVLYLHVKIKPAWTRPLTHNDTLLWCPHPFQHAF